MNEVIFHLAFPVGNIALTKQYYVENLDCEVGRENANSVILNLYGNQLVAHLSSDPLLPQKGIYPRHFGLIFKEEKNWNALLKKIINNGLEFYQQPRRRFTDSPLEHRTFFIEDPFYNLLEFKYYLHPMAIFGEVTYRSVGDQ